MDHVEDEWQISCTEMKQRGSKLYECGQWSDVTLEVGAGRAPFRAHRLVLAMASPVFEAMFFGGEPQEDSICVPDVTPEAFHAMLNYVYSETISVDTFERALAVYRCARRFALPQLLQVCAAYMSCNLDARTAALAFQAGLQCGEPALRDESLPIIRYQTREVLECSSFEQLELETVEQLFALEGLHVDSELDLLLALERHAQSRFKTAGVADVSVYRGALSHIRLLSLSVQQFAVHAARSPLLPRRAALALLTRLAGGGAVRVRLPHGFSDSREHRTQRPVSTPPPPAPHAATATFQLRVRLEGHQCAQSASCAHELAGHTFLARAVPLMVTSTPSHLSTHYLGAFLRCEQPAPAPWSCRTSVEFRLLALQPGEPSKILRQEYTFTSEQRECGTARFVSVADVLSGASGRREHALSLEVYVTAHAALGTL